MTGSNKIDSQNIKELHNEEYYVIKLNPFLIPHVIQHILSYCGFEDLKSTRLVSRLWKDCGTDLFKIKRTLRFKKFKDIDEFMLENLDASLSQNVYLNGPDFQSWIVLLKPFFSQYGSHIKSLNISHGLGDVTEDLLLQIVQHIETLEELSISGTTVIYSDRYIDGMGGGGFQFLPTLPTVKRINLKLPVTCFKRWTDVRTFFTDLFLLFPNVEDISFLGCQFPELFKYFPQEIRFHKLHRVHLQLLNSSGLELFMKRNLPLRTIVLDVEPLLGMNHLHEFLASFASSLVVLDMRFHYRGAYNYSHNATGFPSSGALQRLTTLKLFGYWGNLYFLKDLSKLKYARVERMKWNVAFPRGIEEMGQCSKILKFFDENGVYQELYESLQDIS